MADVSSIGTRYARCYGEYGVGLARVRLYDATPWTCLDCGTEVHSRWVPKICPNPQCRTNRPLCYCGAGAGPLAVTRHDRDCPLRGVNDRHLYPRWRRILRMWGKATPLR